MTFDLSTLWLCFRGQAKEKYEKVVEELGKCTPQYMENMEQVFDTCQQFEEKRLSFLREVLLDVKRHLNLTENQRYTHTLTQHTHTHTAHTHTSTSQEPEV